MKINNCKCGGRPEVIEVEDYEHEDIILSIKCHVCGYKVGASACIRKLIIKKWNKRNRRTRKELKAEIKQLKAEVIELIRKCFLSL